MAISTNSTIHFFGTQDTVTAGGGTSAVSDAAYSASGDVVSGGWTNDDDAPLAMFALKFQYTTGTIADYINLYYRLMNIDGTGDEPQPDAGWPYHYMGTIAIDTAQATSTDTYYALGPIALPNSYTSQVYEFYIENQTNVTIAAGWTLKVTPITYGPHA